MARRSAAYGRRIRQAPSPASVPPRLESRGTIPSRGSLRLSSGQAGSPRTESKTARPEPVEGRGTEFFITLLGTYRFARVISRAVTDHGPKPSVRAFL